MQWIPSRKTTLMRNYPSVKTSFSPGPLKPDPSHFDVNESLTKDHPSSKTHSCCIFRVVFMEGLLL